MKSRVWSLGIALLLSLTASPVRANSEFITLFAKKDAAVRQLAFRQAGELLKIALTWMNERGLSSRKEQQDVLFEIFLRVSVNRISGENRFQPFLIRLPTQGGRSTLARVVAVTLAESGRNAVRSFHFSDYFDKMSDPVTHRQLFSLGDQVTILDDIGALPESALKKLSPAIEETIANAVATNRRGLVLVLADPETEFPPTLLGRLLHTADDNQTRMLCGPLLGRDLTTN